MWYILKEYFKMNPFQQFLKYCPPGPGDLLRLFPGREQEGMKRAERHSNDLSKFGGLH